MRGSIGRGDSLEKGDTPRFLTKLPGYHFAAKKGSVPFFDAVPSPDGHAHGALDVRS